MNVWETPLPGVLILEPVTYEDQRGFFLESYRKDRLREIGIDCEFIQDNHSFSREAGVLRGLHYQLNPAAQSKLVKVFAGAIYDVVVDLRRGSPTFGQWIHVVLSEANRRQLFVPKGFAHGFCTLVANTHVLYKVDAYYSQEHERGIAWNDPDLNIFWPVSSPVLSEKDRSLPPFCNAEMNFSME